MGSEARQYRRCQLGDRPLAKNFPAQRDPVPVSRAPARQKTDHADARIHARMVYSDRNVRCIDICMDGCGIGDMHR